MYVSLCMPAVNKMDWSKLMGPAYNVVVDRNRGWCQGRRRSFQLARPPSLPSFLPFFTLVLPEAIKASLSVRLVCSRRDASFLSDRKQQIGRPPASALIDRGGREGGERRKSQKEKFMSLRFSLSLSQVARFCFTHWLVTLPPIPSPSLLPLSNPIQRARPSKHRPTNERTKARKGKRRVGDWERVRWRARARERERERERPQAIDFGSERQIRSQFSFKCTAGWLAGGQQPEAGLVPSLKFCTCSPFTFPSLPFPCPPPVKSITEREDTNDRGRARERDRAPIFLKSPNLDSLSTAMESCLR